jgi:hypothetical protein
MATYVVGHGLEPDTGVETFVPAGTTIKFFTGNMEDLADVNALAVMAAGGAEPTESYGEGQQVANYALTPLDDEDRQRQATVQPAGLAVMYVGDQLPSPILLCHDEPDGELCTAAEGHNCDGVFGLVNDTEILYLACRGVQGQDSHSPRGLGPHADNTLAIDARDEWYTWFQANLHDNADEVARRWDALPQPSQTMLMSLPEIENWTYLRQAKVFMRANSVETFRAWLRSEAQANHEDLFLSDPEIRDRLGMPPPPPADDAVPPPPPPEAEATHPAADVPPPPAPVSAAPVASPAPAPPPPPNAG